MQLWSLRLGDGPPLRLSYECDRVGAYRVSPDGSRIAYGADEGGNERWTIWVVNTDGSGPRPDDHQAPRRLDESPTR